MGLNRPQKFTLEVIEKLRQMSDKLTKEMFADQLSQMLKEPNTSLIRKIVQNAPLDLIFEVLMETIEI